MKESFQHIWSYILPSQAGRFLDFWFQDVEGSEMGCGFSDQGQGLVRWPIQKGLTYRWLHRKKDAHDLIERSDSTAFVNSIIVEKVD